MHDTPTNNIDMQIDSDHSIIKAPIIKRTTLFKLNCKPTDLQKLLEWINDLDLEVAKQFTLLKESLDDINTVMGKITCGTQQDSSVVKRGACNHENLGTNPGHGVLLFVCAPHIYSRSFSFKGTQAKEIHKLRWPSAREEQI